MSEYDSLSSIYEAYFTGLEGDVDFFLNEAQKSRGRVLELGCGSGRITVPMARMGMRITGLDVSAAMLEQARLQLPSLDPTVRRRIRLLRADMRNFQSSQSFSFVFAPYRSFMHLLTPQDQVQALLNVHGHMTRRGRLVL